MEGLNLLVAALAAYRVTRLLTVDRITLPIRRLVDRRTGPDSEAGYFVRCPWCVGTWVSGAAVLTLDATASVPTPVLAWLAVAAVVGLLATVAG